MRTVDSTLKHFERGFDSHQLHNVRTVISTGQLGTCKPAQIVSGLTGFDRMRKGKVGTQIAINGNIIPMYNQSLRAVA